MQISRSFLKLSDPKVAFLNGIRKKCVFLSAYSDNILIMKKNVLIIASLAIGLLATGCRTMSRTAKTSAETTTREQTDATAEYARPLVIGAPGADAVPPRANAAISRQMDGIAAQVASLDGAQVDSFTDANGLKALRIVLGADASFDPATDALRADAQTLLAGLAGVLREHPDVCLMVYGHTDNVGTLEGNQQTSRKQAAAVVRTLTAQGVDGKRITASGGRNFADPIASNDTPEGRAQNRRVDIYLYAGTDMIAAAR